MVIRAGRRIVLNGEGAKALPEYKGVIGVLEGYNDVHVVRILFAEPGRAKQRFELSDDCIEPAPRAKKGQSLTARRNAEMAQQRLALYGKRKSGTYQ